LPSKNGRTVATAPLTTDAEPALPTRVIVWPDCRFADAVVEFNDMSQLRFLSNHHLLLSHQPAGAAAVRHVVDVRRPTVRYQFSGYLLNTLRVTDAGKWAALAKDGSLSWGQFDPLDVQSAVVGAAVPITGNIHNLLWIQDGRFLLV